MNGRVMLLTEILFTFICETIKEPVLIQGQTATAVTGQGSRKVYYAQDKKVKAKR